MVCITCNPDPLFFRLFSPDRGGRHFYKHLLGQQSYPCAMGNRLIGIDSSSQSWPIAGGRSSKIDENSIVYEMATLPGENLGQNSSILNEFYSSACNLHFARKSSGNQNLRFPGGPRHLQISIFFFHDSFLFRKLLYPIVSNCPMSLLKGKWLPYSGRGCSAPVSG